MRPLDVGILFQKQSTIVKDPFLWENGRVTRLGEFSPIGCLFTLGSFLKMIKVATFSATFLHG
jgi:hypothetical protein